jgi:hypothetical protein
MYVRTLNVSTIGHLQHSAPLGWNLPSVRQFPWHLTPILERKHDGY